MPSATARTCMVDCWESIQVAGESCEDGSWEAVDTCLRERCSGAVDVGQVRLFIDSKCTAKSDHLRRAQTAAAASSTSSRIMEDNTRKSLPYTLAPSSSSSSTSTKILLPRAETSSSAPKPDDKGHVPITYVGIICGLSTFIMFVFIGALLWHLKKKKRELRAIDHRIRRAKTYRNELQKKAGIPSPVSPISSRSKLESIWVKLDEKIDQRAEERAKHKTMRFELPGSGGGLELQGSHGGYELPAQPAVYYELDVGPTHPAYARLRL